MKNFFFVVIALFSLFLNAQQTQNNNVVEFNSTTRATYIRPISAINTIGEESIAGSKYYEENYSKANVFVDNKLVGDYSIRYNGYNDEIELIEGKDKISALLRRDNIMVVLKNYAYKVMVHNGKSGYYIDFHNGKETSLILRAKKVIKKPVEPQSGLGGKMPASFDDDYEYYLKSSTGNLNRIKLKKKEVLNALADKKKQVAEYASSKKLSFKKEEDLIKIIDYYNTL